MTESSLPQGFVFRPAGESDIDSIYELIRFYAEQQVLLPRTRDDLLARIRNFHIAEIHGVFVGCTALRDYGNGLFEVRSLAIQKEFLHQGMGSRMVSALLQMLKKRGEPNIRVFALTYRESFFNRLGFKTVTKDLFPEKIWSDCAICPKRNRCDEIAVMLELQA